MAVLSGKEKCLCAVTLLLLITGLILAICVFLVMPKVFSMTVGYTEDRKSICDCTGQKSGEQGRSLQDDAIEIMPKPGQRITDDQEEKDKLKVDDPSNRFKFDINIKVDKLKEHLEYCVPLPNFGVDLDDDEEMNRIEDFPYIVSISTLAYSDDKNDKRFICTGTIVSNVWVFTASDCLKGIDLLEQMEVRSASPHWSKGGNTHKVIKKTESFQGIVGLKVQPYFRFSRSMRKMEVLLTNKKYNFESVLSAGWERTIQDFIFQSKNARFSVKKWSTYTCEGGSCNGAEVNTDLECSGSATGKPLVPDCSILVGIQTGSLCGKEEKDRYVNMQSEEIQEWAYGVLNIDTRKRVTIPPVEGPIKLYGQVTDDLYLESCIVELIVPRVSQPITSLTESISTEITKSHNNKDYGAKYDIGELKLDKDRIAHLHVQKVRRGNSERAFEQYQEVRTNTYITKNAANKEVALPTSSQIETYGTTKPNDILSTQSSSQLLSRYAVLSSNNVEDNKITASV